MNHLNINLRETSRVKLVVIHVKMNAGECEIQSNTCVNGVLYPFFWSAHVAAHMMLSGHGLILHLLLNRMMSPDSNCNWSGNALVSRVCLLLLIPSTKTKAEPRAEPSRYFHGNFFHKGKSHRNSFMSIRYILFDCDGLILDTERVYSEATQHILDRYGKTFEWSLKAKMMGLRAPEAGKLLVDELKIDLSAEDYLTEREILHVRLF
jgi:hypothetical protein